MINVEAIDESVIKQTKSIDFKNCDQDLFNTTPVILIYWIKYILSDYDSDSLRNRLCHLLAFNPSKYHFIQIVTRDFNDHCQILNSIKTFAYLYLLREFPTLWGNSCHRA